MNSSFYGVPAVKTTKEWAARTPADFEFSLKLYQKFTHPEMFVKATGKDPADLDRKDVDEFRAAIDPLARAGKLGALLAQFPASFKNEPASRGYLEWLLEAFRDYAARRGAAASSFSDEPAETLQLLGEHGAALVQIDEPKFRFSIRQDRLRQREDLLLHAAARPERGAVVEARQVRGSLQLPLLGVGAGAVRRSRGGSVARREEDLPLREQSLLREVGRQRRDDQGTSSGRSSTASTRRRSSSAIRT